MASLCNRGVFKRGDWIETELNDPTSVRAVRAVNGNNLVLDATEFDLWRRCTPWDRVRWSREWTQASVLVVDRKS